MADESGKERWPSYTMVDPKMRKIYFRFYQETYKTSVLDRKDQGIDRDRCFPGHALQRMPGGAHQESHQVRRNAG